MDCKICELREHMKGLKEERKKIKAFERELPFLMQLLTDAIEVSKKKLVAQSPTSPLKVQPSFDGHHITSMHMHYSEVAEDLSLGFVSFVNESRVQDNLIRRDVEGGKLSWITTKANTNSEKQSSENEERLSSSGKTFTQILRPVPDQPFSPSKPTHGGDFYPFQRENQILQPVSLKALPSLTFSLLDKTKSDEKSGQGPNKSMEVVKEGVGSIPLTNGSSSAHPKRKARRYWSSDLQCRFVKALQQLGGSEVATPNQIRKSMKVDGLTKDEVKSHLQKYRLHMRRARTSRASVTTGMMMMPLQFF